MKTNHLMRKLIDEYQTLQKMDKRRLEYNLESLILRGIVEMEGCYFLQALLPEGFDIKTAKLSSVDQTEIECDINHIHLDNYINQAEKNIKYLLEQGVLYAYSLQVLLPKSVDFKVILACTFEPIIDCNIRFHKQRFKEEWLRENLENYNEAILVLE